MGGGFNAAVTNGQTNLWGDPLMFLEPESEHSAATVCEGFAVAGGRVTNFTSGQGLVLMKEVLYTISGKRLPVVMNIGARALTSQGLNVHAGHDDVMSVADCGWGMLLARNAQEAGDFCLIARRAAEACSTPFFAVQDGFLTTHTVETVRLPEPEFMKEFIGNPNEKLVNLMDPANPVMSGVVQNQDSYMKGKIAQRWYYDRIPEILEDCFNEFYRKTGRRYDFVEPYRCEDRLASPNPIRPRSRRVFSIRGFQPRVMGPKLSFTSKSISRRPPALIRSPAPPAWAAVTTPPS